MTQSTLQVGACLAKSPPDKSKTTVREQKHNRLIPAPAQIVTVQRQDAFITLFPEDTQRLTYGIDYSDESEVIGKQWFTWAPSEDQHYRWQIAPARTFATSVQVSSFKLLQMASATYAGKQCQHERFQHLYRQVAVCSGNGIQACLRVYSQCMACDAATIPLATIKQS